MPFIRKRDLPKKNLVQNSTNALSEHYPTSDNSRSEQSSLSYPTQMERMQRLQVKLSEIALETWEKESSELFAYFLDNKRTVLNIQQLHAYRESMQLVGKYEIQLKKKGVQLLDQKATFVLGLYRKVLEEVSAITQDTKNDQIVQNADLVKPLFLNLQAFVGCLETEATKTERRPNIMRKNSLKKIEELPTVRPLSRGKLSSLSKKQTQGSRPEGTLIIRPKIESSQKCIIEELAVLLCAIVKNLSANVKLRRQLLKDQYLRLINRYLCIWTDKNLSSTGSTVLTQLCASYRHLAVQEKSYKAFLDSNCFEAWARLIELFPTNQQLIFNILRTLSKLSNYEAVCFKLNEKKQCIKQLSSFFKFYKANIHIVIRIAIIFANMTSYLQDIRNQLYFDFQAWRDVYQCFDYYANRQLSGRNETDKMGLSMAAWDYQHLKKESDIDCAIRIVRLIANLFTVAAIGQDIYINDQTAYRELVRKLKTLLEKKANIEKSSQLTATVLSCLTNVLFYDRETLLGNAEHRMVKVQLVNVLVDLVVQIDNEQICCQSLRVIANLTRMRQFCAAVIEAKIHQALLILLDSTSKQIVFYSLGVLGNLLGDNSFKQLYQEQIVTSIISILNECENEDFDVVSVGLKTLACIVENRNENLDPKLLTEVESCLMNLGGHCDRIIGNVGQNTELTDLHESRSLINMLLNNMPEQKFICSVKNCGRKFADQAKLQDHVKRRHKL